MSSPKFYSSIEDLPVFNYWKILETGSLDWLVYEGGNPSEEELAYTWNNIQVEVIEVMLTHKDYVKALEGKRREALRKAKAYINNDTAQKHMIELQEAEEKLKETGQADLYQVIDYIERDRGYTINEKTLSTKKYLMYLKSMKDNG